MIFQLGHQFVQEGIGPAQTLDFMLDSAYILVPISIPSKEVLNTECVYNDLNVECLHDKCILWHVSGDAMQNPLFDERNIVLRVSSATIMGNVPRPYMDELAITAAKHAMKLKVPPPALL